MADSSFGVFGSATRIDPPACSLMHATSTSISSGRSQVTSERTALRPGVAVRISDTQTPFRSSMEGSPSTEPRSPSKNLRLESPQGRLRLDGKLGSCRRSHSTVCGIKDTSTWRKWRRGSAPILLPRDWSRFRAPLHGPIDSVTTTIDVAGDNLQWSSLNAINLQESTPVLFRLGSGDRVASHHGGRRRILADARVSFDDRSPGHARLNWRNLHVQPLVSAFAADTFPHVSSSAEGSATFDWSGRAFLTGRATFENTLRATRSSRGELPLAGRATLRLHDGAWQLSHDHRVGEAAALTGHAEGRIDPETPASSTLSGNAELRVISLSDAVALATRAGLADDVGAVSSLDGSASIIADLAGLSLHPRAAGAIEISDLRYGNVGPGIATGRYSASSATHPCRSAAGRPSAPTQSRAVLQSILQHAPSEES